MSGMDMTVTAIIEALKKDGTLAIKGFGVFTLKSVAARKRRNPKTGAAVDAPAFKKVTFKMSKSFRESL
jgi:nucleoid DNA-binding protein